MYRPNKINKYLAHDFLITVIKHQNRGQNVKRGCLLFTIMLTSIILVTISFKET